MNRYGQIQWWEWPFEELAFPPGVVKYSWLLHSTETGANPGMVGVLGSNTDTFTSIFLFLFFQLLSLSKIDPIYATLDKFKNGISLKTHQMFFTPGGGREFRDATINSHFGICLRKTRPSLGKSHYYPFAKCFPSTEKRRKAGVFKFLWFEDRFRKTRLPQRVSKNTFLKRVSYCAQ